MDVTDSGPLRNDDLDIIEAALDGADREARPTPVEPEARPTSTEWRHAKTCEAERTDVESACTCGLYDYRRRLAVEPDGLPLDMERLARAIHNDRQGDDDLCFTGGKMARPPSPWHSCDEDAKRIAEAYARLGPSEDKP